MKLLLDTSIIIDYFRGKTDLKKTSKTRLFISVMTYIELMYGALKSKRPSHNKAIIESFLRDFDAAIIDVDKKIGIIFVEEKLSLQKAGVVVEDYDLLIAATAIVHKVQLVTQNLKHFSRISNLEIYLQKP